jgi:endonuclease/exonuclease/phosphatase family metal-dependent hydrolase
MKRAPLFACAGAWCVTVVACDQFKRELIDRFHDVEPSAWTSREDCEAVLQPPAAGNVRIGTWNVQYFPDADEGVPEDEEDATDVQWLACAVASLDVDVLAIQEFKTTDRSLQKQGELIARLNELTGGDWRIELAPCMPPEVQHPGFLFDARVVEGTRFRELPILSPDPECTNQASPGFGGYFEVDGGPDFHLISVHFQAGSDPAAFDRRGYSLAQIEAVVGEAYAIVPDSDIFFAGDFNTSGCDGCEPPMGSPEEVASLNATMFSLDVPMAVVAASETCTRHDDDDPNLLLDHFVVAQSAVEVPAESVAHVSGICEETSCERLRNWLEDARERLSDHCPVTLDLAVTDDD